MSAINETPPTINIENDLLPGSDKYNDLAESSDEYGNDDSNEARKAYLQSEVIGRIVRTLTSVMSGIAVLMIVIAGYLYLTARGNEDQIKKAHKTIIFACVALFIMLFAYSIVSIISRLTSLL